MEKLVDGTWKHLLPAGADNGNGANGQSFCPFDDFHWMYVNPRAEFTFLQTRAEKNML